MKLIILIFLFICISFGQELSYSRYFLVDRVYLMPFVFKHSEYIGISQEQMNVIQEFVKEHEKKVKEKVEILKHLERRLKEKILEGEKDKEFEELLRDVAKLKTELTKMNIECVIFLKQVLSEDQLKRLRSIILLRLFELQR